MSTVQQRNKKRAVFVLPSPVPENDRRVLEAERRTAFRRAEDAEHQAGLLAKALENVDKEYADLEDRYNAQIEAMRARAARAAFFGIVTAAVIGTVIGHFL